MLTLLKKVFSSKDEQTIIKEIHNEFDTAQDRLLNEADELLKELKIPTETQIEGKATILKSIGFSNTPVVKQADVLKKIRKEQEHKVVKTKIEAQKINYYKFSYPFLKFLTEEELNRICKKYNLIYAPVVNYIKDVPDKNILEIKNAQPLKPQDSHKDIFSCKIDSFWMGCPYKLKKILSKEFIYDGYISSKNEPDEEGVLNIARKLGYTGNYSHWIFRSATITRIKKEGLFICAPKSHFDLKNLKKKGELGFFNVDIWEIQDPIVFRYCDGGVQVLSKWGLEANDEALVNEINN